MDAEPIESDDSNVVTPPQSANNNHTPKPELDGRISSHRGSESRDSHPSSVHHGDDDSRISMQSGGTPGDSPQTTPSALPTFQVSLSLNTNAKKKKLVSDVFQNDDDQEEMNGPKKRKLVPLGEYFIKKQLEYQIIINFMPFQTMTKTQLQNKCLQIHTPLLKHLSHKRPPVSPVIARMRPTIAKRATKKSDVISKISSTKFPQRKMRYSTILLTKRKSIVQSRRRSDLGSTKRSLSTLANRSPLWLTSFAPKSLPVVPLKVF